MAAELREELLNELVREAERKPAAAPEPEAAPESEAAPEPAQEQETAAEPPSEPDGEEKPKEPKEKRDLLIPFLTILLILLGVGEAIFWGGFGLSSYRSSLAVKRYEAQQKALEEERVSQGVLGGSAYGPNLKVENGTVTWEREKWISPGSGQTQQTDPIPRREDGLRLSRLTVPRIPYILAQMEEDEPASEPTPSTTDGTDTPTET